MATWIKGDGIDGCHNASSEYGHAHGMEDEHRDGSIQGCTGRMPVEIARMQRCKPGPHGRAFFRLKIELRYIGHRPTGGIL